jgi:tape measure domain-containing protein
VASIGSIAATFVAKTAPFEAGVKRAQGSMDGFGKKVISTAAKIGAALGGIAFFKKGVGLAAQLEKDTLAIEAFVGSSEKAAMLIKQIGKFAETTPFQQKDLISATKQLLAFGVAAGDINSKLTVLGNLAALSDANVGDLAQIFGKIKSQGKVMGETLNQLAERGIPVISALADHFGVAETEIRQMVTDSKVSFQDFDQALNKIAGNSGKYGNLMERLSKTAAGQWSTFNDKVDKLAESFGTKLLPMVTEFLNVGFVLIDWVKDMDMATVKFNASILAGVAAFALALKWGVKLVKFIRSAIKVYRSFASAQAVALAFSGVGIPVLAAATAAAVAAVIGINMAFDKLDEGIDKGIQKAEELTRQENKVAEAAKKTAAVGDVAKKNTDALKKENEQLKMMEDRLNVIANRSGVGVAVRGTVAAAQARSEAIKSLEKHQVAQLKAQQKANDHLAKIEANTKDNIAIAGI